MFYRGAQRIIRLCVIHTTRKITSADEDMLTKGQGVQSIRHGTVTLKLSTLHESTLWRKGKMGQGKLSHRALVRRKNLITPEDTSWRLRKPGE